VKAILFALLALALIPAVIADDCVEAYDSMPVSETMILYTKAYDLPTGIMMTTSNVTLDCNGAMIRGDGVEKGTGITLEGVEGVEVKNCNLLNFNVGVQLINSNRNIIDKNNLLKENTGIKLFESFENRFESNSDKSLLTPINGISSKFNTIFISRVDLDADFCKVNTCNSRADIIPCVDDDLYCSPRCDYKNDNNCHPPAEAVAVEAVTEYPALPNEQPLPQLVVHNASSAPKLITGAVEHSFMRHFEQKTQFWLMTTLFIVFYLVAFLSFQHHHWKHID
jgi:hypothetical protein